MAEVKTKPSDESVERFLNAVTDEKRRGDCFTLVRLMNDVTGEEPAMWGPSIVGFGTYHYRYESGREGDTFLVGFSPRKQNLTLYIMAGFEQYAEILKALGRYTTGKSCLYITSTDDIDLSVLRTLVEQSVVAPTAGSAG